MKKVPNILSGLRIVGALSLLFVTPFSLEFYTVYALCGLTDILDGYIARERHCETETGAKLDSVADLILVICVFSRLLSDSYFTAWMFIWLSAIAIVKLATAVFGAVKYHSLAFLHTVMNKAAGIFLLLFPLLVYVFGKEITAAACCTVCSVAAIEEFLLTVTTQSFNPNVKTLLKIKPRKNKKGNA